MKARQIRQDEIDLISHLFQLTKEESVFSIPFLVTDLQDGGIGSIRFVNNQPRVFGKELIQVQYVDLDNTEVLISIYLDDQNDLFELDFWKVDFNKLLKYPRPEDIQVD